MGDNSGANDKTSTKTANGKFLGALKLRFKAIIASYNWKVEKKDRVMILIFLILIFFGWLIMRQSNQSSADHKLVTANNQAIIGLASKDSVLNDGISNVQSNLELYQTQQDSVSHSLKSRIEEAFNKANKNAADIKRIDKTASGHTKDITNIKARMAFQDTVIYALIRAVDKLTKNNALPTNSIKEQSKDTTKKQVSVLKNIKPISKIDLTGTNTFDGKKITPKFKHKWK